MSVTKKEEGLVPWYFNNKYTWRNKLFYKIQHWRSLCRWIISSFPRWLFLRKFKLHASVVGSKCGNEFLFFFSVAIYTRKHTHSYGNHSFVVVVVFFPFFRSLSALSFLFRFEYRGFPGLRYGCEYQHAARGPFTKKGLKNRVKYKI